MIMKFLIILAVIAVIGVAEILIQFACMIRQNRTANNKMLGKTRFEALEQQGTPVVHSVYSKEEIAADPGKATVKLYYFPGPQTEKNRYVVICPGGAYALCALDEEGFTPAAQLNELGYTAFVLEYRTGKNGGDFAAMEDLASALRFIKTYAESFHVSADDYALLGFSAGGDLAGLFGTEKNGWGSYTGIHKPSVLFLSYPWCNLNIRSFLPIRSLMYILLNAIGHRCLIGKHATAEEKKRMRIPWQVTDSYPPCYIIHGTKDIFVPAKTHSGQLASALEKNGVKYNYERAEGLTHCFGIGEGTAAEGWLARAIAFWESEASEQAMR